MLGALLEKADISYVIFERSSSVKPLGKFHSMWIISPLAQEVHCAENETADDEHFHFSLLWPRIGDYGWTQFDGPVRADEH